MHVAIYDTEHFENIYTLLRLFNHPRYSISVFTSPHVLRAVQSLWNGDELPCKVIIIQGRPLDVRLIFTECKSNKSSLLILNTVSFHHGLFSILCRSLPRVQTWLTLHDVNETFAPQSGSSPRSWIRYFGMSSLANCVHGFITHLQATKTYVQKQYGVKRAIHLVPGRLTEPHRSTSVTGLRIVIPGSVDPRRRDYQFVQELIESLSNQGTTATLVLSGGLSKEGKEIVSGLQKIKGPSVELITYDTPFVEVLNYEGELQAAQFVLSPLNNEFGTQHPEQYGRSKSSGVFFDAVAYGKPLLIPSAIPVSPEFEGMTYSFSSGTDLAAWLKELTEDKLRNIFFEAKESSERFSIQRVRDSLPQWFDQAGRI